MRLRRSAGAVVPAIVAVLVMSTSFAVAETAPSDRLWMQAVEASRRAKAWSPGEMRLAIELADDRGKVLETWENRYRLRPDGPDGVATEVVLALHNGEDVTAKEREAQAKREADARSRGSRQPSVAMDDPFDPALQDAAAIQPLGERRTVDDRTCVSFGFTLRKKDGGRIEGTAWLEQSTGLPVELSYHPVPLPLGAQRLVTTVRYGGPEGEALPVEILVEGSGALLFIKRTFRSTITLGSHWKRG